MRKIYVLLTSSTTAVAKTIRVVTGDIYSHASIAFDDGLTTLCSFGRKRQIFPLPAGLIREDITSGYYKMHRYIQCVLLMLPVDDRTYELAKRRTEQMLEQSRIYRYSIRGLAMCRCGIAEQRPRRYFCSQFVADILDSSGAVALPKPPPLMRPQDYVDMPQFICLYRGELSGLTPYRRRSYPPLSESHT